MTNRGPPTPPPTTAGEILDEARSIAPISPPSTAVSTASAPIAASAAPETQQSSQDAYQRVFPSLADLAAQGDYHELIRVAETGDLNGDGDRQQTRLLITAPLVLAYLIVDDLPPARHALTRLPDSVAAHPLSQGLMHLLASTWERKHARVYDRAEALYNLVGQQSGFPHPKLGSLLGEMTTTFVESFRQRTFITLSKAYSSLPLALAQSYMGLPNDQLLSVMEKNQWTHDASTQTLSPGPHPVDNVRLDGTLSGPSSLATFHLVVEGVAKLET